jgi:hypothetical protein
MPLTCFVRASREVLSPGSPVSGTLSGLRDWSTPRASQGLSNKVFPLAPWHCGQLPLLIKSTSGRHTELRRWTRARGGPVSMGEIWLPVPSLVSIAPSPITAFIGCHLSIRAPPPRFRGPAIPHVARLWLALLWNAFCQFSLQVPNSAVRCEQRPWGGRVSTEDNLTKSQGLQSSLVPASPMQYS